MKPRDGFVEDINDALQFETREEAEAYALEHNLTHVRVVEVIEDPSDGTLHVAQ